MKVKNLKKKNQTLAWEQSKIKSQIGTIPKKLESRKFVLRQDCPNFSNASVCNNTEESAVDLKKLTQSPSITSRDVDGIRQTQEL